MTTTQKARVFPGKEWGVHCVCVVVVVVVGGGDARNAAGTAQHWCECETIPRQLPLMHPFAPPSVQWTAARPTPRLLQLSPAHPTT